MLYSTLQAAPQSILSSQESSKHSNQYSDQYSSQHSSQYTSLHSSQPSMVDWKGLTGVLTGNITTWFCSMGNFLYVIFTTNDTLGATKERSLYKEHLLKKKQKKLLYKFNNAIFRIHAFNVL